MTSFYIPMLCSCIKIYYCRADKTKLKTSWLIFEFVIRVTWELSQLRQELFTLPEHMSSPPIFIVARVSSSSVSFVVFSRSLFVLLSCFFWPLDCLSFFDFWHLLTFLKLNDEPFYIRTVLICKEVIRRYKLIDGREHLSLLWIWYGLIYCWRLNWT